MRLTNLAGSLAKHGMGALVEASLVIAIVAALVYAAGLLTGSAPSAAIAEAGQSPSTVWVSVGSEATRTSAVSEVQFGSPFTVGYATREKKPWALVMCYPNDTTEYSTTFSDPDGHVGYVWGEYFSVYPGGPVPQHFILGDGYANWTSGGADCSVELVKFTADGSRRTVLAMSAFTGVP